jgi:UTP:GlnB (protein PII) uridylyltransferase
LTVGERAEDVFYITDFEQRPLSAAAAQTLRENLTLALDRRRAA